MASLIFNPFTSPVTLPAPYDFLLKPGASFLTDDDPDTVAAELVQFGLAGVIVKELGPETQPAGQTVSRATIPLDVDVTIDPVNGLDGYPGTATKPLRTWAEALKRASRGYRRNCIFRMVAGVFNLPASTTIRAPSGVGQGALAPVVVGTPTDSGLGPRIAGAGSTVGSGITFGTVVDSVGGLTVNAWNNHILRLTSGANSGRKYFVDSNTATTFSLVGTTVAVAAADTFVIEKPGSIIRTADGSLNLDGGTGPALGLENVHLDGQSFAASNLQLRNVNLLLSACWVQNFASVNVNWNSQIGTPTAGGLAAFLPITIPQTIGAAWISTVSGSVVNVFRGSLVDIQRSRIEGFKWDIVGSSGVSQFIVCAFAGASGVRCRHASTIGFGTVRMTGVAAFVGVSVQAAALILEFGASGTFALMDISGTTGGNAIALVTGSHGVLHTVSGTGNANHGMRMTLGSNAQIGSLMTVTGTDGELKVGARIPVSWATAFAGAITDLAEPAPQLCVIGP